MSSRARELPTPASTAGGVVRCVNCSERGEIGLLHPRSRTATVLSRLGSTLRHRDAGPRPLTRRSAAGATKTKQTGARHAACAAVVVANEAVAQAPGGAGGRLPQEEENCLIEHKRGDATAESGVAKPFGAGTNTRKTNLVKRCPSGEAFCPDLCGRSKLA